MGGRRERESVSLFIWLGVGAKDTRRTGQVWGKVWEYFPGHVEMESRPRVYKILGPNFHWESGKGRRGCIWPPTNVVMATT